MNAPVTPLLLHLVGAPRPAREFLLNVLVAGLKTHGIGGTVIDEFEAAEHNNAQLRTLAHQGRVVIVPSSHRQRRHLDLAHGDVVLTLTAAGPEPIAASTTP